MDQMTMMLNQSNDRMTAVMKDKLPLEKAKVLQAECGLQIKIVNAHIQAYAVSEKNKRALSALSRKNIYNDRNAISIGADPELDMLKCPEQESTICRADCLDYSGSHAACDGCPEKKETHDRLLPTV